MKTEEPFAFSRYLVFILPIIIAIAVAGTAVTIYQGRKARKDIASETESAIDILSTLIIHDLNNGEQLVTTMSGSPWIYPVLETGMPEYIKRANSVLDRYNIGLSESVCYLMNKDGFVVASSNRNDRDSFVGKNYSFRPYFKQAITGGLGRYFALGVTSNKRGFYASRPVKDKSGRILGAAVVKKDIELIEDYLRKYPYCFFVSENGIIFMSSNAGMLYKSLWPIDEKTKQDIIKSKQFGVQEFNCIFSSKIENGSEIVFDKNKYFVASRSINKEGWSIVLFGQLKRVFVRQMLGVVSTLFLCFLVFGTSFFVHIRDKASYDIKKSNERFFTLASNIPGAVYRRANDENWTAEYISDYIGKISGYPASDFINNKVKSYASIIHPDDRVLVNKTVQEGINSKKPYTIKYRIINSSGAGRYVYEVGQGIFKGDTLLYLDGVIFDHTEAKAMEEKLLQSEKLAVLGKMSAFLSHDIRNPLSVIKNTVYCLLSKDIRKDENTQTEYLNIIKKQVDAAANIVTTVLGYTKSRELSLAEANIEDVLNSVIEEIKIPKRISIEKDYKSGNKVMFDFFQIKQAMINVIKNAVESIENEGWISLKTYKKGDSIRIDIADSGCGIKEEDREKIFEPLFSKKDMGTGLGLCIVKDIIERHKGNIIVESQEGIGTKVIITIPIAG